MAVIKKSDGTVQKHTKAETEIQRGPENVPKNSQNPKGSKNPKDKAALSLLCNGMDVLYLLWLLFSLWLLGDPSAGLARFSVWGASDALSLSGTWLPAFGPLVATFCALCSFWALLRFGSSLRSKGFWQNPDQSGFFSLFRLCLPARAVCFLLQDLQTPPTQKQKQSNAAGAAATSQQAASAYVLRFPRSLQLCVFLALALQLGLLGQLATQYWPNYGQAYEQYMQGVGSTAQGAEAQASEALQKPQNTAYLPELLGRIDVWFLSLKGLSAGLAMLESSAIQVGAVVYGSVSIGKILVPIRNSLERISDILFYGRVLLTAMQVVQSLGRYYAAVLLWSLLALLLCSYIFGTVFAHFPKPLAQWQKCLSLLRAHVLFFLLLSFLFEPGLTLLDGLVQKVLLQQNAEFLQSETVLADLEQQYGGEELTAGGRWSALIDSAQRWLGSLRSEFAQLGRKLFYFALTAVLRTLVLPLLALWLLYLFYRSLLGSLLRSS